MPINVTMPALSPTMEEGTLAKWLVAVGDKISSGDIIAEIETDKATMEVESADEGTIGKIVVAEGTENVPVNAVIAILLEEGEDATAMTDSASAPPPPAAAEKAATQAPSAPAAKPEAPAASGGDRVFASPLARRLAGDKGIDLKLVTGSGPHGRIVKADIEGFVPAAARPAAAPAPVPAPAPATPSGLGTEAVRKMYADRAHSEITLDGMRKTIAARLSEAKSTIPHFYLRRDIQLDTLLAVRKRINDESAASGIKLSVNDFIIKACAMALQRVPAANAVWAGDRILQLEPSDVAVAVAIEGGLFTPVLRDAHAKGLAQLSAEMKDLAARARTRKLAPHEYQGGSFAISNLGMFGIDNFDAVINPPHASILAVGAGVQKPVVKDGAVGVATVMSVTLSVDHRVIDGALGAEFLGAIRANLEDPLMMLV